MLLKKGRPDLGLEVVHKALSPQPQGLGIMTTNIIHLLNDKRSFGFLADVVN